MSILAKDVSKRFGPFVALDHVSVEAPSGGLLALLDPSGSGKTTLLRIIAGLETADSGVVLYEGEEVTHRPARERNVGFVFQHYALFRHLNVFENVAFALRVRRWREDRVRERVGGLLRLVRLEGLEGRKPAQLSGGSAWPSPVRWRRSRACCCWTSRSARWTRRCGRSCGPGCGGCTTRSA
jgi:sulfate/thiosulfate transport system ATP-binding protein